MVMYGCQWNRVFIDDMTADSSTSSRVNSEVYWATFFKTDSAVQMTQSILQKHTTTLKHTTKIHEKFSR